MNENKSVFELHKDISINIDNIYEIKKHIQKYGVELGYLWSGRDERILEGSIEQLVRKLERINVELEELNHDILLHQENFI